MTKVKVLVAIVLLGASVGVILFGRPFAGIGNLDPEAGLDFQGPFIPLQAEEFYAAYKANQRDADARFLGKGVEVTGTIMGVDPVYAKQAKDSHIFSVAKSLGRNGLLESSTPAVVMSSELGVIFLFPKAHKFVPTSLKFGETVTLRGICAGVPASEADVVRHVYITGTRSAP